VAFSVLLLAMYNNASIKILRIIFFQFLM